MTILKDLLPRYDGVLLDAFGVLVDSAGALPGAAALLAHLEQTGTPYFVVTNDASRHPTTIAAWFETIGLKVDPGRVLSSGAMLARHYREAGLTGARTVCLGTEDSRRYVIEAGGNLITLNDDADFDVLAVCDDHGFDFLTNLDSALTVLYRRFDADRPVHLLLANPDLLYPRGEGRYGFTSGAIALLLEAALEHRFPSRQDRRFVLLGKPNRHIFEEAMERLGSRHVLMVGDQLKTDIIGARRCGLDAALVRRGLGGGDLDHHPTELAPTYLVEALM